MKGLQGKVALVTGGSSGIGQAIAIRLGEEGATVAINYVGRPEGAATTREAIEHGVEMCMKKVAEAGGGSSGQPIPVTEEQKQEVREALEGAAEVSKLPFYEERRKERLLDMVLKRWYAIALIALLGIQILVVDVVLVGYAWKGVSWRVQPVVINIWLGATVVEVIGVVLVVTQHLFPRRGDDRDFA